MDRYVWDRMRRWAPPAAQPAEAGVACVSCQSFPAISRVAAVGWTNYRSTESVPVLVAGSGRALMPKSRSTAAYQDSSSWALQSTHCSSL